MGADQLVLSPAQARKIVLLSQGIHKHKQLGSGANAVLRAIEQLGYVQIDTISVVARAHHHNLWNRVAGYQAKHLAALQESKRIFEYWSHAAAYLPMRDYRFSLPRKRAIAGGEKHWHAKNAKLNRQVLKRIQEEGPLQARDFEHKQRKSTGGWWQWKPAKRALEQLFMEGELMVARRQGFQKVYDLSERVLPDGVDSSMPSQTEYQRHLVHRYLHANGIGTPGEISYLRRGMRAPIAQQCRQMLEDGQLLSVRVKQQDYYARPDVDDLLAKQLSRSKLRILSPFDNLLIQRKRTLELFNFDYQIECYVPAAKRQYGYFCLPLLWGQAFAGRMDAKIDRKSGLLQIINLHLETAISDQLLAALKPALGDFMEFNQGHQLELLAVSSNSQSLDPKQLHHIRTQLGNI